MLLNDNWISLKQIHDEIFYCLLESESEDSDPNSKVWEFCASSIEIRAAMPDGTIKNIPKEYVEKSENSFEISSNTHVSLSDGRIGTGSFVEGEEMFPPEFALQRQYGHLLGCHIIFRKNKFKKFLDKLNGNEEENSLSDNSQKAIAKLIIQSVADGTYENKAWAKENFGAGVSWRAFKLSWGDAVKKHPELSHAGRPLKKPYENQDI